MSLILEMRNVKAGFGERTLFEDFNMELHENEIIGITGPSGSGKSTILRIAVDFITPSKGDVRYRGKNVEEWDPQELRRCLTLIPQEASMFPGTVRDNLLWGLRIKGRSASDEELIQLLKEVDLPANFLDKIAGNLSGGEKQRVAIARALLLEPCALLLDEPTSALDENSTLIVEKTIQNLIKNRDIGVLIVTHDKHQAERFTDRVIEIKMTKE